MTLRNWHDLQEAQAAAVEARRVMADKRQADSLTRFVDAEEIALSAEDTAEVVEPDREDV